MEDSLVSVDTSFFLQIMTQVWQGCLKMGPIIYQHVYLNIFSTDWSLHFSNQIAKVNNSTVQLSFSAKTWALPIYYDLVYLMPKGFNILLDSKWQDYS